MQGLPELREAISKYLLKRTGVDYKKEKYNYNSRFKRSDVIDARCI